MKMKKTKKILRLLLLILVIMVTIDYAKGQNRTVRKKDISFQVKVPDGLYMCALTSPLVIVENGKLIDPYALILKIGHLRFEEKYVKGKRFNVYEGSKIVGKVEGIKFEAMKIGDIDFSEVDFSGLERKFAPNIYGNGNYKGIPFSSKRIPFFHRYIEDSFDRLVTPESLTVAKDVAQKRVFSLTENDIKKIVRLIQPYLTPDRMKGQSQYKRVRIRNDAKEWIDDVKAVDIDGNGKKDFLVGNWFEPPFVLWDSGRVERIPIEISIEKQEQFECFVGVIDLDQDGVFEITLEKSGSGDCSVINRQKGWFMSAIINHGVKIEIWRYTHIGWKNIYSTQWIGTNISIP